MGICPLVGDSRECKVGGSRKLIDINSALGGLFFFLPPPPPESGKGSFLDGFLLGFREFCRFVVI